MSSVERSVHEAARVIPRAYHLAVDGTAVGMHVEHVHEHADLQRVAIEMGIAGALDLDDLAVGGREHGVLLRRHDARRIAEELQDEDEHERAQHRECPLPERAERDGERCGDRDEGPALAGKEWMRIVRHGLIRPCPGWSGRALRWRFAARALLGRAIDALVHFLGLLPHRILEPAHPFHRIGGRVVALVRARAAGVPIARHTGAFIE